MKIFLGLCFIILIIALTLFECPYVDEEYCSIEQRYVRESWLIVIIEVLFSFAVLFIFILMVVGFSSFLGSLLMSLFNIGV